MDYLTKWPEVLATSDQSALTIVHLLVEQIISCHGVPAELLSDRGKAFLSKLLHKVYDLMGMKKVNITAYHPQMDGLVERFNRTLTRMLAKTVKQNSSDWDKHLPYVLYAYRTPIRVALNRVRCCPVEIPDSESPDKDSSSNVEVPPLNLIATADQAQGGVWQNRLRPRK